MPADERAPHASLPTPELLGALDPLLAEALDLAPGARAAWLEALRVRSPDLAAEVAALLDAEGELDARGFLVAGDGPALAAPSMPSFAPPSLAGRRLGAYTLERPLGRGGMGTVWLARRSDGRYEGFVAVKLLNLALLDAGGAERFRREGTALARLTHPNIAHLLDAGVSDDGQPFLVLEYIEGRCIDDYCAAVQATPEQRIALVQQVLAAVEHAHANLVVHRDLKPSNILVTADGTVKLLDFGIAKLLGAEDALADRTELTVAGGAPLTPEYAAPEQLCGGPVSATTDVYALGVLLYVLLGGRHPTHADARTPGERLRGTLDTEPPRLSAVAPQRWRRFYRGDLDNILAKALEKRAADRYPTAAALADDLRRCLGDEPVRARRATLAYRARKFVRRNRGSVALGVAIAATLLASTAIATHEMLDARRQRDEARVQRDEAQRERQRAAATSGFMESVLQTVAPDGRPFTTAQLLTRADTLLEHDHHTDPRFVAGMLLDLATDYATLDATNRQMALMQRAAALAIRARDDETAAQAECAVSAKYMDRSDSLNAQAHLDAGNRWLARVHTPATRARMQCLVAQAFIISDGRVAMRFAREAVRLARADGDTLSVAYIDALQTVIDQYMAMGVRRYADALAANRQLVASLEHSGRGNSLLMMRTLTDQVQLLFIVGEERTADSVLGVAAALGRRVDPGYVGATLSVLAGQLQLRRGHADSALASYERAVTQAGRRLGSPDGESWALERHIIALIELGRVPEAQAELARRLAMRLPPTPGFRETLDGRLAELAGDTARAYEAYRAAIAVPDGPTNINPAIVMLRAARLALALGRPLAADSLVRGALRACHAFQHDDRRSGVIGSALAVQARVRLAFGDTAGARDALRRALPPLDYGFGPDDRRAREARQLLAALGGR